MDAMHKRERSKQEMEYYGQREQANSDVLADLATARVDGISATTMI
jgi:hypothetical protein